MGPGIAASTVVWVGCGLAILAVGGLVRARGRVDLLAASTTADPAAAAATLVFVAGGAVVGYGPFERYVGLSPVALALCVSLVIALSFAAAVRSRGG